MTKKMWIFTTAAAVVVTYAITLTVCKYRAKHQKRMAVVSDAGYETAYDVHFPLKKGKKGRSPMPPSPKG
jgi:hypothetical protein